MNCLLLRLLLAAALALAPPSAAEFTMVVPDSSQLVDAPQNSFSTRARTDPNEQKAVYEIMEATGNGWATSIPDICRGRWHGIECMPDRDDVYHVVSLSFGALSQDTAFPTCDSAVPFISPALLRLPHLRRLFFYRCLAGNPQPIPAFLAQLGTTLHSLVLRENGHVGPIPAELGNLTALRVLDLHSNHLHSSIPTSLSRLTHLQLLDLSSNQLTGPIPDLIIPSLTILDLSHNLLQGKITNTFSACDSLIKMDLSRNQLMGPIPDSLTGLQSITLLDLSHNRLSGPLPSSIGRLVSLRALMLNGNPMGSAAIPLNGFVGLKELTTLVLSDMGLQGPIPETIGELQSLRVLHLDGNELNGTIPPSFERLEKLTELRVNDNQLNGPIPFGREMLWRMGRKLRVYNNSGLCYGASNGGHDGIEGLSGISHCGTERTKGAAAASAGGATSSSSRTTEHLSPWTDQYPPPNLSSSGCSHEYSLVGALVWIAGLVVFVFPVL